MITLYSPFIRLKFSGKFRITPCKFISTEIRSCLSEMATSKAKSSSLHSQTKTEDQTISFFSNSVRLKVLGSGAYGAPSSVLLFTDKQRFLFNCGESIQRLACENKTRLVKWDHIFVTYPSWKNCGGLLGMALTLRKAGLQKIHLHGHNSLEILWKEAKKYANLKDFEVKINVCKPEEEYFDGNIKVKYVHLFPSSLAKENFFDSYETITSENDQSSDELSSIDNESDEDINYYDFIDEKRSRSKSKSPNPRNNRENSEISQSEMKNCKKIITPKYSVSYIFYTPITPGKLLIENCVELGLQPGPLLGKLKNGEDVQLEDGTWIKSADVTLPPTRGVIGIVVECPTDDYLDSLLNEPSFQTHQMGGSDPADIVVHFSTSKTVKNPKYQQWINKFPKETIHLYINEENHSLGLKKVYNQQYILNLLSPEIFPLLSSDFDHFEEYLTSVKNVHEIVNRRSHINPVQKIEDNSVDNTIFFKFNKSRQVRGDFFLNMTLRPKLLFDYCIIKPETKNEVTESVLSKKNFVEELNELKNKIANIDSLNESKTKYPQILFLGTGSSQPGGRRNHSAILIFLESDNLLLLDCGEGTFNQMVRFFGKEKAKEVLRNLNIIYISHLHADHHVGLITILRERKLAFEQNSALSSDNSNSQSNLEPTLSPTEPVTDFKKVTLLAPEKIFGWLNIYSKNFENISDLYQLIPNQKLMMKDSEMDTFYNLLSSLNLKKIKTAYVQHCPEAFGVAIHHQNGWKLTYSGDTKPCPSLIRLGYGSDILIHEATLDDTLVRQAERRYHSTTSQAIEVGEKMNARFILLTHFSQRYSHLPLFNGKFSDRVGVAFDNMLVSPYHLKILPKLQSLLKIIFSEKYEFMEERIYNANKRKALADIETSSPKSFKTKIIQ